MSFKKQMKKHIDQTLDENVPNPYPKKKPSFPHWLKVGVPIATGVLAASIALAVIIPHVAIHKATTTNNGVPVTALAAPKHLGDVTTNSLIVKRTAIKALDRLNNYFNNPEKKNMVLSPASYLLATSALLSVSDGFNLEKYGIENAKEETKTLLESWNCYWDGMKHDRLSYSIDSGVLFQQVGNDFKLDPNKTKEFEDAYIATDIASQSDYVKRASKYFQKTVGLEIPIPDVELPENGGVIAYAALVLKDFVDTEFESANNDFYVNGSKVSVNTAILGTYEHPMNARTYFENDEYQGFQFMIGATNMMIILPKENISLESIPLSEAFTNVLNSRSYPRIYGYAPYFHLKTNDFDLSDIFLNDITGNERFFSQILENENALRIDDPGFYLKALQNSDFEFSSKGIFGQSVTAIGAGSSGIPSSSEPIEIKVDRPFYAISVKDNFPLFVNKVNDPRN